MYFLSSGVKGLIVSHWSSKYDSVDVEQAAACDFEGQCSHHDHDDVCTHQGCDVVSLNIQKCLLETNKQKEAKSIVIPCIVS